MKIEEVGPAIRAARENMKMSQESLGRLFGVSRQAVHMWETGENYPALETWLQIVEFLKLHDPTQVNAGKLRLLEVLGDVSAAGLIRARSMSKSRGCHDSAGAQKSQ